MSQTSRAERARSVQAMFSRVAPRYDLMNRLMTGGQDVRWREEVIRRAELAPGQRLLDLGAGTGDLSREALRRVPDAQVVAADFTLAMELAGRKNTPGREPLWSTADALNLPFPDESFDAVVSGFLLRNVVDLQRALSEQRRVLKPGGRLVALDTTRPTPNLFSPFIRFHMRRVIPALGALVTGQRDAYVYLPTTSEHFLSAEELADCLTAAGFRDVSFRRLLFGVASIHSGKR